MTNLHTHSQDSDPFFHLSAALREMGSGISAMQSKRDREEQYPSFEERIARSRYQNTLMDVVDRAIQDAKFPPKCEVTVEWLDSTSERTVLCGLGLYRDSVSGLLMCPDGHVEPNQESE